MTKKVLAKDCKCINCGEQAVCFWPIVDPDIPDNPYCRKCVDEAKERVMAEMLKIDRCNHDMTDEFNNMCDSCKEKAREYVDDAKGEYELDE